jgi:phage recombination protein Bet
MKADVVATTPRGEARTQLVQLAKTMWWPEAPENIVGLALDYCAVQGIDIMLRPVHVVKIAGQWQIIPGIALHRIRAQRSGEMVGVRFEFPPEEAYETKQYKFWRRDARGNRYADTLEIRVPPWVRCIVLRWQHGEPRAYEAIEYWDECVNLDATGAISPMWARRPRGQLAKVAEAQALRRAFPEACPSGPTIEELGDESSDEEAPKLEATQKRAPRGTLERLRMAQEAKTTLGEGSTTTQAEKSSQNEILRATEPAKKQPDLNAPPEEYWTHAEHVYDDELLRGVQELERKVHEATGESFQALREAHKVSFVSGHLGLTMYVSELKAMLSEAQSEEAEPQEPEVVVEPEPEPEPEPAPKAAPKSTRGRKKLVQQDLFSEPEEAPEQKPEQPTSQQTKELGDKNKICNDIFRVERELLRTQPMIVAQLRRQHLPSGSLAEASLVELISYWSILQQHLQQMQQGQRND